jgi:hypothetical protein
MESSVCSLCTGHLQGPGSADGSAF